MRYKIGKTIVNTQKAIETWSEKRDWNGQNHIGRSSGSQWSYEDLYLSSKNRFYLVRSSWRWRLSSWNTIRPYLLTSYSWQGSRETAEWIEPTEAVAWLELNEYPVPERFAKLVDDVTE